MPITIHLQHPRHHHPLVLQDFTYHSISPPCFLCNRKISADGYTCKECNFVVHRGCAEAPPRIDVHPSHPDHPLALLHHSSPDRDNFCSACSFCNDSLFRCAADCNFNLDIGCALSSLSDRGGSVNITIPEKIHLPIHPHPLTSFSTSHHDFAGEADCEICKKSVEDDLYMCLGSSCYFHIHKGCVHDLCYADKTKAPRVYHGDPLETFLGEDTGSTTCAKCGTNTSSREFVGCATCRVFYCRDCIQVPEIIQFPQHPDHNLVLLMNDPDDNRKPRCDSCSDFLNGKLCYGCPSCEFFVDVRCALQVLTYSEEGMRAEIDLPWHKHPLLPCHRLEYDWDCCSNCEEKSDGPMYACKEEGCKLLLHMGCIKIESTIFHPHHPDHRVTLCSQKSDKICNACGKIIDHLHFYCELCAFYLHAKCAALAATRKHPLHEHDLLQIDKVTFWKCNRFETDTSSPFFRCVPCDFNLHEGCMALPRQVENSKIHWHPLT